jgi:hypothetical protein
MCFSSDFPDDYVVCVCDKHTVCLAHNSHCGSQTHIDNPWKVHSIFWVKFSLYPTNVCI